MPNPLRMREFDECYLHLMIFEGEWVFFILPPGRCFKTKIARFIDFNLFE